MEEREKGGERKEEEEEQKEEFMGLKLKRGLLVGKSKGGVCTPPPTWTFEPQFQQKQQQKEEEEEEIPHSSNNNFCSSSITARQLGANLWEVLPHLQSLAKMSHPHSGGGRGGGGRHHHRPIGGAQKNKGLEIHTLSVDPHDTPSDEQPVSTGSFHKQIAASLMRHHRSVGRNVRAMQPVSPVSYTSSMEITPYNPAATPSSSLDYKGRMGDPNHSLKTSTELLKVLNRIWCLEEQHASNSSLVKGLKMELDNARSRIKDLLREKQMDRQVMDELMQQVSELKLVKKNMEKDLSMRKEELEDERKLRKRSESLHRKLAREISEMKSSFLKALNELERERKARILLEDLCDEFSIGIRDYEQELRSLKYRTQKEEVHREHVDSLVLHISEAWLDERVQMKLAEEKSTIVDKLRPEIETFLKARKTLDSRENNIELSTKNPKAVSGLRRQSLESFPLNEATSAPQNVDDEDDDDNDDDDNDTIDSDSHCFELNKNLDNVDNSEEKDVEKRKGEPQEVVNKGRNLSSLQARYEKHMGRVISSNGPTPTQKEAISSKRFGCRGMNTNHMLDNLLRNNSSSIEGERIHPVSDLADDSHGNFMLAGPASPVKKWESKMSESSSRWPKGSKENTLKAKLLEARLDGRNFQSKGSKAST